MSRKAIFITREGKKDNEDINRNTYDLKSFNFSPVVKELSGFESDIFDLIKKIKFGRYSCSFQSKLNNDIRNLKSSAKVFIPVDKTSNP